MIIVIALMDPTDPSRYHSSLFVHTLMLIDGNESHDLLMSSLRVLDDWIEKLSSNGFFYQGILYEVNFVLTGDMKFIQPVKGIQGATSIFSCPLCLKPKLTKKPPRGVRPPGGFRCSCDSNIDEGLCCHWSGSGVLRTQERASELVKISQAGGDCWQHMGHHKPAPLKSVSWDGIVMDTLHALLRITDVLFGSLLEWVLRRL